MTGRHGASGEASTVVPDGPFRGLSAYPLTPLRADVLDGEALRTMVRRLAADDDGTQVVDSIGALGSTGSYAYLDRQEWTTALRTCLLYTSDAADE